MAHYEGAEQNAGVRVLFRCFFSDLSMVGVRLACETNTVAAFKRSMDTRLRPGYSLG